MSGKLFSPISVHVLVFWSWTLTSPSLGDSVKLNLDVADPGPFLPGVGGFIDFNVYVEILDTEGDGPDTQGLNLAYWDTVLYAGGNQMPEMGSARTGEFAYDGDTAFVPHPRYDTSDSSEELFLGGFGFINHGPGFANPDHDGLDGDLVWMDWVWFADVQPNAPGLQPQALAGVGYGERPAGGPWTLKVGQIPIPMEPGTYVMELINTNSWTILPDVDLTVDQGGLDWIYMRPPEDLFGDSFTYTVLPEPGSALLLLCGAWFLRRRRGSVSCERRLC